MTDTDRFALRPNDSAATTVADLLLDGRAIGLVQGRTLERQFWLKSMGVYVLLVSDDIPYEETLHVYLLDENAHVLEQRSIGAPYTPGILTDLVVLSEGKVTFSFHGREWQLIVHERPTGLLRRRRLELRQFVGPVGSGR